MSYQVQVQQVEPLITAVIRHVARPSELKTVVPQACGEVWQFLRAAGHPRGGRHVALYLDGEINLEVGAEVDQPFAGNDRIVCSRTPAGLVATTAHFGPYHLLGDAYAALQQWCKDHGHVPAGPNWEIYGHWTDDPAQLRTDVFFLLTQ